MTEVISSQSHSPPPDLSLVRRLLPFVGLAIAVLGLLILMVRLQYWSPDDIGNAWRFLTLSRGLESPELWRDPHYNRFPLGTAYLYWTHGSLLKNAWVAFAIKWLLISIMTALLFINVREKSPAHSQGLFPLLATLIFVTSPTFFLSIVDLSCNYHLTFLLVLAGWYFYPKRHGFVISALCCGLAGLFSEIGVALALQLLLFYSAEREEALLSAKRFLWLALAWGPFIASKAIIWAYGGIDAVVWKVYRIQPLDAGKNLVQAFQFLLLPRLGLPTEVILPLYILLFAALAFAFVRRRSPVHQQRKLSHPKRVLMLFVVAIMASLFPFIFIDSAMVSERLYGETALVLVLWSPLWLRVFYPSRFMVAIVCTLLLVNQLVFFRARFRMNWEAARAMDAFKREAARSALAEARFDTMVLNYRMREAYHFHPPWGLPLLVQDSATRVGLLGWAPLRENQHVFVVFGEQERICLPTPLSPLDVELTTFSEKQDGPTHLTTCDASCQRCVNIKVRESFHTASH